MDQNCSAAYLQMATTLTKTSDTAARQPFIIGNCKNVLTHDLNLNLRQHQFYTSNDIAMRKCKLVTNHNNDKSACPLVSLILIEIDLEIRTKKVEEARSIG